MNSRITVFKEFVVNLASLSKCEERQVASIITDSHLTQVYSIGINGGPKHLADCMCNTEGKYGCIHAEINSLVKCTSTDDNKTMFITLAPCKQCAGAIINSPGGFGKVFYIEDWKDDIGLQLLKAAGIQVMKI